MKDDVEEFVDAVRQRELERARRVIAEAHPLVIFTGAGASADSGVPTFRGASAGALWGNFDPMKLASAEGFTADPKLVYDWYTWRRTQLAKIEPNPAHHVIAEWQRRGAVVITQNVDGLHERVAPPGATILRVHGTIAEDRCSNCSHRERIDLNAPPPLRSCPQCSAMLRPAVVWFGEELDEEVWSAAERAAGDADVFLVVGTSGEVWPAAGLVERASRKATVIVVNLEPSSLDELRSIRLQGRAAEILPRLLSAPVGIS